MALIVAAFAAPLLFLQYHLPLGEVVRIVGAEVVRVTGDPAGDAGVAAQDMRYIHAVTPEGQPRVYRNQDTGWGWPPYFKFSSADLAAEADLAASASEGDLFVVTSYGWRIPILSLFPNAVGVAPAPASGGAGWPWVASVVLVAALAMLLWLWRRVSRAMSRVAS